MNFVNFFYLSLKIIIVFLVVVFKSLCLDALFQHKLFLLLLLNRNKTREKEKKKKKRGGMSEKR